MFPPVMGPVTIRRIAGRTPHGDPIPGTEFEQPDCCWSPRNTEEQTELRETVETAWWLFGPFDADIRTDDEVVIPGVVDDDGDPIVWQVHGEIDRWRSPWTQAEVGFQLQLRRATG